MNTANVFAVDVNFFRDDEAHVRIVTSGDVSGSISEDEYFDKLAERVRYDAPQVLELTALPKTAFHSERKEMTYAY